MATLVKDYVTRCNTCQRFKGSNRAPAGLLQPLPILNAPWEHISADFIMNLPLSHSYDSILTVVDRLSKEVELIACTKTCLALDTAKLFLANVLEHHGLPCSITSDWGPQFAAQVMQELTRPLVLPLSYWHIFIRRQMDRQRLSIRRLGSFYKSIALKSRIHGLPGCQSPSSPLIQRNTLQPRSHPSMWHGHIFPKWELNPLTRTRP